MKDEQKLRKIISEKRIQKGYSRDKVSEMLKLKGINYAKSSISRYENGDIKNIKIDVLSGLCEILGLEKKQALELAGFKEGKLEYETIRMEDKSITIPIFSASAGTGLLAIGSEEVITLELPKKISKIKNIFAVKVNGVSMEPEFKDGDILILDPNIPCYEELDKQIVVIELNGERYVKQLRYEDDYKPYLFSYNKFYPPILINGSDEARIIGRIVHLSRNYI